MGRRDAVAAVLQVVTRMRQLEPRLKVTYESGWETRGNGTSADYVGGIIHHTATPSSLSNPFPTQTVLRVGRSDLPGPLCNFAGPACSVEAPWIHVMAAHPANHAGASGGRSMGPLPVTSLFNPRVMGLEIDYAGLVPMLPGQLRAASLWARAVADVLAGGNVEYVRAHMETSITGKWDPGYANGRTIDMAAFRRGAAALAIGEDDMPLSDVDKQWLRDNIGWSAYATMPYGENAGEKVSNGLQLRDIYLWTQHLYNSFAPGIPGVHFNKDLYNKILARIPVIEATLNAQSASISALAKLVADGSADLTPEQVEAAVNKAIMDAGAALRAVEQPE